MKITYDTNLAELANILTALEVRCTVMMAADGYTRVTFRSLTRDDADVHTEARTLPDALDAAWRTYKAQQRKEQP
jgi:hypothetical protein